MSKNIANNLSAKTISKVGKVAEVNQHLVQVSALNKIIASKDQQLKTANERLTSLELSLRDSQSYIEQLQEQLEQQLGQLQAANKTQKETAQQLQDRFDEVASLTALIKQQEAQLAQLKKDQTSLKKKAEIQAQEINTLTETSRKQKAAFESQLSQAHAALEQAKKSALTANKGNETEIKAYKKRIAELESSAAKQDKTLAQAAANLLAEQKRVQKLERQLYIQKITYQNPAEDYSKLESLLVNHRALMAKMHKTSGELELIEAHRGVIASSDLFDAKWYLATYQDLAKNPKAAKDPAGHFLLHGGLEGRNPSPKFDSEFYLAQYPDVFESGMNPLLHYLGIGQFENRYASKP
ncbi:hypothetical protein DN062_02700 [Nitrincola tibetensis]|uniref:Uncharacterized protein n=1 Tax=Nitrincola tibetensis TaxID=2219697 RepID=A0A364NQM5_9GAMM|nr:hypothetical protein [Nitrincola tibetensis]RAU19195.1 hypothetical protein DN062_02700 [Nitrincola tibetensis]